MEVIGIIIKKFDPEQKTDNFTIREFILRIKFDTAYPQEISFQLTNANCDKLDRVPNGVPCKVKFELKGRCFNNGQGDKWFNTLSAWDITKL